jgi:triosephosphate isomerase
MKILIVANWKMNPLLLRDAEDGFGLIREASEKIKNVKVVLCPPFVFLTAFSPGKNLWLGAQDCFWQERGPYTGEISPVMLKNLKADYVILGHSERRKYQKETDEMVARKIGAALRAGLTPILCVDKISQIEKSLKGIKDRKSKIKNLVIAYEPLFAIGTGRPCSPEKAGQVRMEIQRRIQENIPILYGGSVSAKNAPDYIKKAGFQGLLVGTASLTEEFIKIIKRVDSEAILQYDWGRKYERNS